LSEERGAHNKSGKQDAGVSYSAAIVSEAERPAAPRAARPYNE
jgi:hypothetical protein